MDVEETEDLGLGIPEGMQHRARLECAALGQLDHHLRPDGPFPPVVALRQTEALVQLSADGANRPVADHGEGGADVHPRHESGVGGPVTVGPLIREAHAPHPAILDQRLRRGGSGPDLDDAGSHHLGADPLGKLSDGEQEAAVLPQERGNVGQREGVVLEGQDGSERADAHVGCPEERGAPAGPDGVQQVDDPLGCHGLRQGNLGRVQVGEALPDPPGARDHTGDAEADVVGALVADDLGRHPRHRPAQGDGYPLGPRQAARESGEESPHGRAEAHADDIHLHRLAIRPGVLHLPRVAHAG